MLGQLSLVYFHLYVCVLPVKDRRTKKRRMAYYKNVGKTVLTLNGHLMPSHTFSMSIL